MSRDTEDFEVGYKRPPQHTRFRPGRSGNPRGRPKGTRNLASDLEDELADRILVREGGRQLKISRQPALLRTLVDQALTGDTRAAGIVLQLVARLITPEIGRTAASEDQLPADDRAILERFLAEHLAARR
jgi:Family of unknown function (DUF5681)